MAVDVRAGFFLELGRAPFSEAEQLGMAQQENVTGSWRMRVFRTGCARLFAALT